MASNKCKDCGLDKGKATKCPFCGGTGKIVFK